VREPRRGDVYRINFDPSVGHEQKGLRYAIVVQNNFYSALSTTMVIPTSQGARPVHFHVSVWVKGEKTYALVEQLTTVDKTRRLRPERYVSTLSTQDMESVSQAVKQLLGLDPNLL
jgi:mRNA-degrading endonuclease toxin of MazEF toxin-antitoxin module